MRPGPEELLQRSIVQLWAVIGRPDVQMQADATGLIGHKRRGVAAGMGVRAGWPDLTFIDPKGRVVFIELKTPKGKLSPGQVAFQKWCIASGITHGVIRNLDDVRAFWRLHGLSKEALR